jgi:hypothetical protein
MVEHILKTTVPPPEEWEYAGEFRWANHEWYILGNRAFHGTTDYPVAILRRARWVPKPGDAYWAADGDSTGEFVNLGNRVNIIHREEGNQWQTWQQAADYSKARKALAERMHNEQEDRT